MIRREMVTQSLLQSKILTTSISTKPMNPLIHRLCALVDLKEEATDRGAPVTIAERQALEKYCERNNMTLSNLISQASNFRTTKKRLKLCGA
jgi:hypothetical protein